MNKDQEGSVCATRVSRAGFNLGVRLALPVLPGMIAFGLAVGATAARKGFSFLDNVLMNLFVYAGMSQLVVMESWPERFSALALAWMGAITAGYLAGALIADPRRYGIDLVMPIFFAAMLIPLWRGARRSIAWVVAGAVALIVQQLIGGWWFIVAGAIAGSVAGGFVDDAS